MPLKKAKTASIKSVTIAKFTIGGLNLSITAFLKTQMQKIQSIIAFGTVSKQLIIVVQNEKIFTPIIFSPPCYFLLSVSNFSPPCYIY